MRRIFFGLAITLLIGSFFVSGRTLAANSDVVINEIGAYEPGNSGLQWVEIWNRGQEPVDMVGWKFWENSTNHGLATTGTTNYVVQPGEYRVISQSVEKLLAQYPLLSDKIFDSSWSSLSKDGEEIGLKDKDKNSIEIFTYVPITQFSLERKNPFLADFATNNWIENLTGNTIGAQNSNFSTASDDVSENSTSTPAADNNPVVDTSYLWPFLKINEIMIDPNSGEHEWVELHNTATTSIDLAGWILCDDKPNNCEIASAAGTLKADGYVVLTWSSSELNNDEDKVILKNPKGTPPFDEVQYGVGFLPIASNGNSLALGVDDAWVVTTAPTPGVENIIVAPVVPVSNSSGGGGGSSANSVNNNEDTKTKSTKTATSTIKIKEDPIKIVWKIVAPAQGVPNEPLIFDVSDSADPRGGLLQILWDFGDGVTSTGEKIEHSFVVSGVYAVLVSATSTVGTFGNKKLNVHIASDLSTTEAKVKISEVLVNPVGVDKKEFIKLFNTSSSTVDLSGWKLNYKDKQYIMPENTNISATSSLVFYQVVTHFALDNTGGKIELLTPNDNVADVLNYGKATEGQSQMSTSTAQVLGVKITAPVSAKKPIAKSTSNTKYFYGGAMSIADARAAVKNTFVKVRGTVAVLPAIFGVQYFYITDETDGIQIYQNKKLFPDLRVGDEVDVNGVTSASGEMKRVNVKNKTDMRVLSHGTSSSTPVAIEDLDENTLGALVQINGEITEIKTNFMYVDDGTTEMTVYFKQGAKIDKKQFKEGDLVAVTGILEQSKTGLQLWPRGQTDIQVTGQSEDLINQAQANQTGGNNMLQIYLAVTAGGITVLVLASLIKARGIKLLEPKG